MPPLRPNESAFFHANVNTVCAADVGTLQVYEQREWFIVRIEIDPLARGHGVESLYQRVAVVRVVDGGENQAEMGAALPHAH